MDKPLYRPGEVARFRVASFSVRDSQIQAAGGRASSWTIENPAGKQVASGKTLPAGNAHFSGWRVPESAAGGKYKLTVTPSGEFPAVHEFHVRAFRTPELNVAVEFLGDGFGPGDTATAIVTVSRADGSDLSSSATISGSASIGLLDGIERDVPVDRMSITSGTAVASLSIPNERLTGSGSLHIIAEDGGVFEAVVVPVPVVGSAITVEFVPESRMTLIAGVDNIVYFAAEDIAGNVVDVEGTLFEVSLTPDSDKSRVCTLNSSHKGRGTFHFTPQKGFSYHVELSHPSSIDAPFPLPEITEAGASLTVLEPARLNAGTAMAVRVHCPHTDSEDNVELRLYRKAEVLSSVAVTVETAELELELPNNISGVLRVALSFNDDVQAERIVFVHPPTNSELSVNVDLGRDVYLPGEEATITVKTTDSSGAPRRAAISITVTDESGWQLTPLSQRPSRLPERILLSDEVSNDLGGHVWLPQFHSGQADDPISADNIDLLMGSQGWRKFAYRDRWAFASNSDDEESANRMLGVDTPPPMLHLQKHMMFAGAAPRGIALDRGVAKIDMDHAEGLATTGGVFTMAAASGDAEEDSAQLAQASGEPFDVGSRHERELELQRSIPEAVAVFAHRGPADGLAGGERFDWTQTVYWSASEETSDDGQLQVTFRVSHSMTSMRVMVDAVALFDDEEEPASFAVADGLFSIREPLFVEPKLPLHAVAGDRIVMPLSVNNRGDGTLSPLVALSHIGEGLSAPHADRNLGAQAAALAPGASTRLLLDVTVDEKGAFDFHEGLHASIGLRVEDSLGLYSDAMSRTFHVIPAGTPVTADSSGTFSASPGAPDKVDVDLTELRAAYASGDVVDGTVAGELKVYPTPLTSLLEAVQALLRKPHGCFEQTSSAHFPNIMIVDFLQSMGLDQAHAPFLAKTLAHLEEGYRRLVSYETEEEGFEWFGAAPPHEALTAYGLLEFSAMDRLRGVSVDQGLLRRTRDLLLSLREGDGFSRNPKALDSFGRASLQVTTAYIVWAMSQSGVDSSQLSAQIDGLTKGVWNDITENSANPYVVALLTDSLYNFGMAAEAEEFGDALSRQFNAEGLPLHLDDAETITVSHGTSKEVEVAAVAVLAMVNDPQRYGGRMHAVMDQLLGRCKNGAFGGTQATVLGLRAVIAYWKLVAGANADCSTAVFVAGQEVASFTASDGAPPLAPFLTAALESGEGMALVSECEHLLYSTSVQWRRASVPPSALPEFTFSVALSLEEGHLTEADGLFLEVDWCNAGGEDTSMLLASVGVPGGVDVDTAFLDQAVAEGAVDYYELASDNSEVYLYWRGSQAGDCASLRLPAVATVPGSYRATPSHFYQYYDDERQIWLPPLQVDIAPIQ